MERRYIIFARRGAVLAEMSHTISVPLRLCVKQEEPSGLKRIARRGAVLAEMSHAISVPLRLCVKQEEPSGLNQIAHKGAVLAEIKNEGSTPLQLYVSIKRPNRKYPHAPPITRPHQHALPTRGCRTHTCGPRARG
jgi:hypothetical protein